MPVPRLWLVPLAAACAGAAAAWWVQGQRLDAADAHHRAGIAAMRQQQAEREAAAQRAAAQKLAAAQEAERAALHALHATRARLDATNKRLREALHGLPTSGRCGLSFGAVGLLDGGLVGTLPAGAARPDRADAGSSADPARPAATEAAVGAWIADAAALYDECRARLDAIRQWDEVTSHGR